MTDSTADSTEPREWVIKVRSVERPRVWVEREPIIRIPLDLDTSWEEIKRRRAEEGTPDGS